MQGRRQRRGERSTQHEGLKLVGTHHRKAVAFWQDHLSPVRPVERQRPDRRDRLRAHGAFLLRRTTLHACQRLRPDAPPRL